ncbi:hypothetical protein CASFOL_007258 [Castilleja foliolosa]|uniref:Arf-GAP domain-containing protein n=1 Tax=Castilleja foliolosa TaxID=1961234 RepID=A0ABD3E8R8_9LAMI
MPRRVKDEERIETIIRDLLKQPENRRCVNCNSLGPQYVCTTFWTFVCTICSGVHREFTHRVKSVSMAKFNDEEISALQAGGNERAKEIYFKAWDPQRNSYPDGGNLHSLREFVRHVYIDRKYAGENKNVAMVKLNSRNSYSDRRSNEKNDFFERQFSKISSSSSRDDPTDRCSFDQSSPFKRNGVITFRDILEERSPRSSHESANSSGSQRHRPVARFEIVDDRFRDDGSVKRYDHRNSSSISGGSRSPVSRTSAPTNARPVLKIEGPPKYIEKNEANATIQGPTSTTQKQNETVNQNSLMDFDAKPGPTNDPPEPQAITPSHNESSPVAISSATQTTAPNTNSLESWLFDFSDPASSPPAGTSQSDGSKAADRALEIAPVDHQPLNDGSKETVQVNNTKEIVATNGEEFYSQQSNNSRASNEQILVQNVPQEQSPQATDQRDISKATARKEIPQDLFSSNFGSFAPAVSGWQMHPPYGTGYGMQYRPPVMSVAASPNSSRPINPFDVGDEGFQAQPATFHSSMQGAMPNIATSSAQPSPYARTMSPHMSPYGMNMPQVPGAYMEQLPNNMQFISLIGPKYELGLGPVLLTALPQGDNANFAKSDDAFGYLNPMQQTSGANSSINPSLSRTTRNPFG